MILTELRVWLSGLRVKPDLISIQETFNAEIPETDAEFAER
jgi:hypothetical protein